MRISDWSSDVCSSDLSRYQGMIRRADNSRDQVVLKQHLQEARYFLNSLEARNETLLRVAQSIVEEQRAFLDYGPEAMRPMVLRDIAEQIGRASCRERVCQYV